MAWKVVRSFALNAASAITFTRLSPHSTGVSFTAMQIAVRFAVIAIACGTARLSVKAVDDIRSRSIARLLIEPGKVLFLNNAINQGILTPLGVQESTETGKSILFLLEANPGPGLGLLIAFMIFGTGTGIARASAPARSSSSSWVESTRSTSPTCS